jgi:hypothetical protein
MKRIKVKRLVYYHLGTNEVHYGGFEYDGNLTDENILGAVFTLGKHEWCPNGYGMYQLNANGELKYRITVEMFYRYQKSWYNLLWDWIRRVV